MIDFRRKGFEHVGKSDEWAKIAKRHLKTSMVHASVRNAELAARLTEMACLKAKHRFS